MKRFGRRGGRGPRGEPGGTPLPSIGAPPRGFCAGARRAPKLPLRGPHRPGQSMLAPPPAPHTSHVYASTPTNTILYCIGQFRFPLCNRCHKLESHFGLLVHQITPFPFQLFRIQKSTRANPDGL